MALPRASELHRLKEKGLTALVSLTEWPPATVDGLETLHVPIPDMSSPTLDQLVELVSFMRRVVTEGGTVVAHCAAGLGRTGTLLAAYLVGDGLSAGEAIRKVRLLRPGSIETEGQERSVHRYAELIGGDPA